MKPVGPGHTVAADTRLPEFQKGSQLGGGVGVGCVALLEGGERGRGRVAMVRRSLFRLGGSWRTSRWRCPAPRCAGG